MGKRTSHPAKRLETAAREIVVEIHLITDRGPLAIELDIMDAATRLMEEARREAECNDDD